MKLQQFSLFEEDIPPHVIPSEKEHPDASRRLSRIQVVELNTPQENIGDKNPFGLSGYYALDGDISDKIRGTMQSLRMVFQKELHPVLMCSFGKDSSVLLELATIALREEIATGNANAKLTVATSMVGGSENPVMSMFVQQQIEHLEVFAEKSGLPIDVKTVTPNLSENFLLQMLGGRSFASFPGQNSTCSVQLKVSPLSRLKKEVTNGDSCTLLGTYYQESSERNQKMVARGDRPDQIRTTDNEHFIAPMAHWTADDVFHVVAHLSLGDDAMKGVPTYLPDASLYLEDGKPIEIDEGVYLRKEDATIANNCIKFSSIIDVYLSANGGACTTDAFNDGKASSQGCGGRFGCHNCVKVKDDVSLQNMVQEEEYEWMKIFADIRDNIAATQYDLSKRIWLSKAVNDEGMLKIEPGSFSPDFAKDLLRWYLTAKADTGYDVVTDKELIWVAAQWGRYGIGNPIEAIEIWQQINKEGKRFYPPENPDITPKQNIPRGEWAPVADEYFGQLGFGANDVRMEMVHFDSSNKDIFIETVNLLEEKHGIGVDIALNIALLGKRNKIDDPFVETQYMDALKEAKFNIKKDSENFTPLKSVNIDEDAVQDVLWLYSEELVNQMKDGRVDSPSSGFKALERLGVIQFPPSQESTNERMLQRSDLLHRLDLLDKLNNPFAIKIAIASEQYQPSPGEMFAAKSNVNQVIDMDINQLSKHLKAVKIESNDDKGCYVSFSSEDEVCLNISINSQNIEDLINAPDFSEHHASQVLAVYSDFIEKDFELYSESSATLTA